ncbi:restriction endonuclease subunit S [Shewanella sp. SP1S1-7]|uniref:restriction endonuclease subunit S n=1 Tax=Shewanella sp. SP1S1-7 TaxID=3063536 RepID=UPI00288F2777|nr:restriction endonuclease subunit S [Shewanella sp. SP1S1-7]MDT3335910.1 restriction endonuclease subunit S [Shewanella sp. SP1S1-7]
MSQVIPEGWVFTNLGKIIELKYGKSLPAKTRDGVGAPVYGSNGIVGRHSTPLVNTPGIVVGRKGSFGEVTLASGPFSPIDTTYFVDEFYDQPLMYWFYQLKDLPLTSLNRSTAIPGLNREDAYEQAIKLPPLAEQKVIADKLDELLAQVESTKARLDAIPAILKSFRQSLLAAAVSGKLTEEWRGGNDFKVMSEELGKLAKFIDYRGKTPTKTASGIPLITAKNIRQGFISREPREFIANEDYHSWMTRGIPNYGDVLITTEAPMGYVANIDIEEKFALAQRAICLQFKEKINSYFVSIYMQASVFQKTLDEHATGSTVKGIKAALLKKINIEFPPLEEQTEIVRSVEELFVFADKVEAQVNAAQTRVNNLTQSILAKAFRGELTGDWRAANPELISGESSAEALLKHIKAEREDIKTQPNPKRTAIKKKIGSSMSKQIIKVVEALKEAGKPLSGQQLLAAAGYPSDSNTDQLERFFLDIRDALTVDKSIVKVKRGDDGQDWFTSVEVTTHE